MRVSAVSHLGKGLARPSRCRTCPLSAGRMRSAAGLLRLETALEEFVDQQFDMLALDLPPRRPETAASAAAPLQRAGQLPERIAGERQATDGGHRLAAAAPWSRGARAIPSPAGATACPQMQASLGCWQSGQCRPPSVEYTSPPRADRDEAFLTTGRFPRMASTARSTTMAGGSRPRRPTQAGGCAGAAWGPPEKVAQFSSIASKC